MSHLKIQKTPKNWPIKRKGSAYVVRPNFNIHQGIPILILVRDVLKLARNKKEVKRAIHLKNIELNKKRVLDEKNSASLFDILTIVPSKKHYRIELNKKGKFVPLEVTEKESNEKVVKIVDKKIQKGKKAQLNFGDGRNLLSEIKCHVGDSVLINFKDKKIEKCIELKEKTKIIVFAGKHAGEKGVIVKMNKETKMAEVDIEGNKINILIKQLMALE